MSNLPKIEIDPEEYAREIAEAYSANLAPDDPGATTTELAEQWGVSVSTARERVAKMTKAGSLIRGLRTIFDETGRPYRRRVYRLKKEKE